MAGACSAVNGAVKVVLSDLPCAEMHIKRGYFFLGLCHRLKASPTFPVVPLCHLSSAVLPISLADGKLLLPGISILSLYLFSSFWDDFWLAATVVHLIHKREVDD